MFAHSSSSLRPDVIELNFPVHIDWKDREGRSFSSSSLWIFDVDKDEWRLPGTSFRLAFAERQGTVGGQWFIDDGFPQSNEGLRATEVVKHPASPVHYGGTWALHLTTNESSQVYSVPITPWGPTTCRSINAATVCNTLESSITGKNTVGADHTLSFEALKALVIESMSFKNGLSILPWLKSKLLALLESPLENGRIDMFEVALEILNSSIGGGLIRDQDPFLAGSADKLVRLLLSMNFDWRDHRRAQSLAMNVLAMLCHRGRSFIGQDGSLRSDEVTWKHTVLVVSGQANVLSFVADATVATMTNVEASGACTLLTELLSQYTQHPRYASLFENAASSLRSLILSLLETDNYGLSSTLPAHLLDLSKLLEHHPHTAQRFQEAKAGELEWWLNICQDDRNMLCEEADDIMRCAITFEVMRQPVVLVASGETYERNAICRHLAGATSTKRDPRTNVPIQGDFSVVPDRTLQRYIRNWCEERVKELHKS